MSHSNTSNTSQSLVPFIPIKITGANDDDSLSSDDFDQDTDHMIYKFPEYPINVMDASIKERHDMLPWRNPDGTYVAISDNGAAICLLSNHAFYIDSHVTNAFANIKSFDP